MAQAKKNQKAAKSTAKKTTVKAKVKTPVKTVKAAKKVQKAPARKPVAKVVSKARTTAKKPVKAVKSVKKPAAKPVSVKKAPVKAVKTPVKAQVKKAAPRKTAQKAVKAPQKPVKTTKKAAEAAKNQRIQELKRLVAAKAPNLVRAKAETPKIEAKATKTVEVIQNQKASTMANTAQQMAQQAVKAAPATVAPTAYAPQRPANLVAMAPIQVKKVPANDPALKPEFKTGQLVVYPAHGVGRVEAIESQRIAGQDVSVFKIFFEQDRMTLKVPMYRVQSSGLRALATNDKLDQALETMKGRPRIRRTMWSRRAQEYEAKINSGDPVAIAEVLRDLRRNADSGEQSYSERQIFYSALGRLAREVAAVERITEEDAQKKLESVLITRRKEVANDVAASIAGADAQEEDSQAA